VCLESDVFSDEIEEYNGRLKASRQRVGDLERNLSNVSQSSHQHEKVRLHINSGHGNADTDIFTIHIKLLTGTALGQNHPSADIFSQ